MAVGAASDDLFNQYLQEDKVPWYRKRNLRLLYLLMSLTCIGTMMTSGYDQYVINGLQAVPTWDAFFGHPRSTTLGLLSALYSLGAMCSLPFVPLATDKLGRRWAIALGSAIIIIGAALQTASQDFAMFITARFLLGFGLPFAATAAPLLMGELAHPKERARLIALSTGFSFAGSIIAAGVTFGTFDMPNNWGWRIPSMLQAIPSLIQLTFVGFLPESPRWLMSKGRGEEAYAILTRYHGEGNSDSNLVRLEYAEIEKTLELVKEQSKSSWKQLIANRGMRRRLLVCSFIGLAAQWSGNGLIAYYLPRILDNVGVHNYRTKNLIHLAVVCWGLVNSTMLALTVPKWKRRTAFLTCTIALTAVFTGWTIASAKYAETGSQAASWAVIVFIFLFSPAFNIGYTVITYTYLVELFPYHARAKGFAVTQCSSHAAGFFNQFVNPIGIDNAGWKYYIVYCIILLFQIVFVYFLFPETSNRSLEELASLYEDEEVRTKRDCPIKGELQETKNA